MNAAECESLKERDARVPLAGNEKKTTIVESSVDKRKCRAFLLPELVEPEDLYVQKHCTKDRCDTLVWRGPSHLESSRDTLIST